MKIITVANQKGGSGKTATAAAISHAAKIRGLDVLAIDLDPQCNLSFALKADTSQPGSYELLTGNQINHLIQYDRDGIDVIAGSVNLTVMTSGQGNARILQDALKKLRKKYDVIIVDTPPTAGVLQYNGLQACTDLVIPIQADAYSLQGLYLVKDTVDQFKKSNPDLKISGVVITRYDGRSTLSKQFFEVIQQKAGAMGIPFLGYVREGVAIKEAAALRQNLFEYAPNSKPAQDYMTIADTILNG